MSDNRPAWSRESVVLRLPAAVDLEDLSPEWAFDGSTGSGVRVAVIDSGIEADHPLLEGAVDSEGGVEFVVDHSGRVEKRHGPHADVYGHGTACAGIIHALAPAASITSVRVLDDGLRGRAAAFHAGLSWAVDNGFDVINLSLGAAKREWALAFHDACDRGYFANTFIVTAANNIHRESFPSLFASVTSVASNNSDDPLRFHFNPEPPTEFLARGIDVVVPWLGGTTITTTGNSFAAPHITGFAALIKAKHPELRPFQIKTALWAASANVRESPATAPNLSADAMPSGVSVPVDQEVTVEPSASAPTTESGEIQDLMADYQLGILIARGPWGPVYSATKDGKPLALRRLDPALAVNPSTRARFAASVRIASGLNHPHILPILELREHDYFAIIAMPRCPSNLALDRAALADSGTDGPGLECEAAIAAVVSLLHGLHAAHAAGIYHGDLRPENALVDTEGRVVVSDVGIASSLSSDLRTNDDPDEPSSWNYLAPEQIEGGAVGAYTDIHAAGLLAYELLTGSLPNPPADSLASFNAQRQNSTPRPLADLASELATKLGPRVVEIIDRAVSPDPSARPLSALAMATGLTDGMADSLGPDWLARQPYRLDI